MLEASGYTGTVSADTVELAGTNLKRGILNESRVRQFGGVHEVETSRLKEMPDVMSDMVVSVAGLKRAEIFHMGGARGETIPKMAI